MLKKSADIEVSSEWLFNVSINFSGTLYKKFMESRNYKICTPNKLTRSIILCCLSSYHTPTLSLFLSEGKYSALKER